MLEHFMFSQLTDMDPNIMYQHDASRLHWSFVVREFLNGTFPHG
jgi:hypothetical protein